MMVAIGDGYIINLDNVSRIKFRVSNVVGTDGTPIITGCDIWFLSKDPVALTAEQATRFMACLNAVGSATNQSDTK